MNCIFCRPLKRFGIEIPDNCAETQRTLQEKFQAWRYARTNDQQLFADDPDSNATREAAELFRTDPKAALPQLTALAERGSIWCMGYLAYCYQVGKGVAVNLTEAERWYRRAFERGSQQAQLRLGRIMEQRHDFAECERIYSVGVADQWAPAMYYLARVILRQPRTAVRLDEARRLLKQSAVLGDLGAATDLGRMMARGEFGFSQILAGFHLLWRTARDVGSLLDNRDAGSRSRENAAAAKASWPNAEVAET